jgi:hypothetical protein
LPDARGRVLLPRPAGHLLLFGAIDSPSEFLYNYGAKVFPVFEARDRGGSPLLGNPRGGWAMRMGRLVQEVGIGHGFDDAGL